MTPPRAGFINPSVKLSTLLLVLAGIVCGWIALATPGRTDWTAPPHLALDEPVPATLPPALPEGHEAFVLDVDGMCCNGCPRKLYEKLMNVEGVVAAAVSFESRTAAAILPRDSDVAVLQRAIDSEKYTSTPR